MITHVAEADVSENAGPESVVKSCRYALIAALGRASKSAGAKSVSAQIAESGCARQSVVGEAIAAEAVQLRGSLVIDAHVELIIVENAVPAGREVVDQPRAGIRELLQQGHRLRRKPAVRNQIAGESSPARPVWISSCGIENLIGVLAEIAIRDPSHAASGADKRRRDRLQE